MKHRLPVILTFLIATAQLCAQQVSGIVYDKKTQEPMEGVTVYFDSTTRGTITNSKGVFKIDINKDIRTSLVVSFLGYRKIVQNDYSEDEVYTFYLQEEVSVLNEIYLSSKKTPSLKKDTKSDDTDIWSRKYKLREFKKHFLGNSRQALSCEILNEDDIILTYDKPVGKLMASSKKPIRIRNKHLEYEIAYDLQEFEVLYVKDTLVNEIRKTTSFFYTPTTVYYEGTSFYKTVIGNPSDRIDKRRTKAYQGSVLHFMRAVYTGDLSEEGFKFIYDKHEVAPEYAIIVNNTEDPNLKEVCLLKPVIIIKDAFDSCSTITPSDMCFKIDNFGNHSPIKTITFSGFMGDQRVGDALPLDYEPELELRQ